MMTKKLKPCPFCGGEAKLFKDVNDFFIIGCNDGGSYLPCYCDTFYRNDDLPKFNSKKEAIEVWNRRV